MTHVLVKTIATSREQLSESDQAVPREVEIRINESVERQFLANAALDVFHSHIAIDEPEGFQFEVWLMSDKPTKIDEHPTGENYQFSGAGHILVERP